MKARIVESRKVEEELRKVPHEVRRSYEIWARLGEEHGTGILREFRGYHDEGLYGEWKGYRSSRLNRQWRLIYQQTRSSELEVVRVERIRAHDYRRTR